MSPNLFGKLFSMLNTTVLDVATCASLKNLQAYMQLPRSSGKLMLYGLHLHTVTSLAVPFYDTVPLLGMGSV